MPLDAPGRAPLVGRDEELGRLVPAAGVGAGGSGGLVLLSGDAGIGKTRLLAELAGVARAGGWRVVVGHCLGEAGSTVPHLPFTEVLGRLSADLPEVLAPALEAHPAAARLVGRAPGTPESAAAAVAEDVHAVLGEIAAHQPLLLVVEDVHWADTATRDLLTLLLTRGFETPVSLVVSVRGEDLHRRHPLRPTLAHWSRLPAVTRVELGPLAGEAVSSLVRRIHDDISASELGSVVARAEGNAFFAEELAAAGRLGHRGAAEDLSRLLLVRLDHLDDTAQQVVRLASAAGRRTSHALLAEVANLPAAQLDSALRQAVEHHVLVAAGDGYAFRHALLAETVYDDLLPGERVRTHTAFAEVLAARPDLGPAAELARHADEAGLREVAVTASIRAGADAMALGGPQEALAHLERALRLGPSDTESALRATAAAADAASAAGRPEHAVALLQDRLDRGPETGGERADLLAQLARALSLTETTMDTENVTREAVELVDGEGDTPRRARVLAARAQALAAHLRHDDAATTGAEAVRVATVVGLPDLVTEVEASLARLRERRGEREESLEALERALASAGRGMARVRLLHHLGSFHHRAGRLARARELYAEGMRESESLGRELAPYAVDCRVLSVLAGFEAGEWDDAARLAGTGRDAPPVVATAVLRAAGLTIAAARGEPGVLDELDRLRPRWEHDGMLVVVATAARLEVHGQHGDLDASRAALRDCVEVNLRLWAMPTFEAMLRLDTLLVGQLATAASTAPTATRAALREEGEGLFVEAGHVWAKALRNHNDGPEAVAWWARAQAEVARLRWLASGGGDRTPTPAGGVPGDVPGDGPVDVPGDVPDGVPDQPDPTDLVTAWRAAEAAFSAYGHPFEVARCRLRLAQALAAAGEPVGDLPASVAATARALGAAPLLAEVEAMRPSGGGVGPTGDEPVALTPREVEVLELVALGRSNKQVGERLFISTKTVSVHVSNILAKLGAEGRGEAAAIARERGLLR